MPYANSEEHSEERRVVFFRGAPVIVGATLAVLQVLDVLSTKVSLATIGVEANPTMVFLMKHLGDGWWLPKCVFAGCLCAYFATRPKVPLIGWAALAFSIIVTAQNASVIARAVGL
jgi:hypothetical protein